MIDRLGRDITYLRISVTDKCNLRCRYCMPEEGVCKKEHVDMLTEDEIICQCGQITRAEIVEAIRRGATTVDGVKRRVGSGMGRCQGSRCTYAIEKLLEEYTHGAF